MCQYKRSPNKASDTNSLFACVLYFLHLGHSTGSYVPSWKLFSDLHVYLTGGKKNPGRNTPHLLLWHTQATCAFLKEKRFLEIFLAIDRLTLGHISTTSLEIFSNIHWPERFMRPSTCWGSICKTFFGVIFDLENSESLRPVKRSKKETQQDKIDQFLNSYQPK